MKRLVHRFGEYRDFSMLVQAQTGKSVLDQAREIRGLKRYGGQCGLSDYYWYKLYDKAYQMGRGAEDFIGWRLHQQLSLALNPRHAVLPGWDKLVFTLMADDAGLPVAPIRAHFSPTTRRSGVFGAHLKTRAAAGEYLRDAASYPLFGKPAYSQQGVGTAFLAGYDSASDCLQVPGGPGIPVETFLDRLEQTVDRRFHKPECGYLFQEPLTLAPEIRAITDWPAICGVRVICLNGPEGVKPISAGWKIALPPNRVDNFSQGKYGNLSAHVDLATGEVGRVINGFWPRTSVIENHPITGRPLKGFRLPGWQSLLDACHLAGKVFPLMKIHHWDFALTDKGPIILELNDLGGIDIDQMYGHGLLTREVREFLRRHGNSQAYPWIDRL